MSDTQTKQPCTDTHDWEGEGYFGVIIGVSKCKRCGITARLEHFPTTERKEFIA